MKRQITVPIEKVIGWVDLYGVLCQFLDETTGFGEYKIVMHGRRPTKVGRVGKMTALDQSVEWVIDVSRKPPEPE